MSVQFINLDIFNKGGGGDPTKYAPHIVWGNNQLMDVGGSVTVAVSAPDGTAWEITSELEGFTGNTGVGSAFATVKFPVNTGETARDIVLTVTGEYGSNSITVTQFQPLYVVATYNIENTGSQQIINDNYYFDTYTVDDDPTKYTARTYDFQTTGEHTVTFHMKFAGVRNCFVGVVTSLNIPDVELIPNSAFYQMTGLTSVVYAGKEITRNAFMNCTDLTGFTAPNMEIIGQDAFRNCTALTSIDLTKVKRIDSYGLAYCSSLTAITIPDNCVTDHSIINYCSGLTELHVGSGVTEFSVTNYITAATYGDRSYVSNWAGKLNITTVEIGNDCDLSLSSFSACTKLTGVTFGTGITDIPQNYFNGTVLNNVKWKNGETVIGQDDVITIPAQVTSIGQSAFRNIQGTGVASSVVFKNRSTTLSVPNHAFRKMDITGVSANNKINFSGSNIFAECSNLSVFDGCYGEVNGGMFKDCKALEYLNSETQGTAVVYEGATNLGNNAFVNCSGITTIDLPSTLTSGATPFSGTSISVIIARPTTAPAITLSGLPASGTLYTPADADYSTWLATLGADWSQETIPA